MSHLDDEAVASLAIGDGHDAAAAAHAAECAECAERVTHMNALADRIGALGRNSGLLTPPDRVWEKIVGELGDELDVTPDLKVAQAPAPEDPTTGAGSGEPAQTSADATETFPADLAARRTAKDNVTGQPHEAARGNRRTPWLVGIAAGLVGLVAGAGIVTGIVRSSAPTGAVVAQAALQDLATEADAGTARVERLGDGREVLVLDTDFEDVLDGYLEVWLIDPNVEGMVSLGHLTQADEEFVIPDGYDVAAFPIVDISVEPLDGVPTHSGDSVTRGVLEAS